MSPSKRTGAKRTVPKRTVPVKRAAAKSAAAKRTVPVKRTAAKRAAAKSTVPGSRSAPVLQRADLESILGQIDAARTRAKGARRGNRGPAPETELERLRGLLVEAITGTVGQDRPSDPEIDVWDRGLDGDWDDEHEGWGDEDEGWDDSGGQMDGDPEDGGWEDEDRGAWGVGGRWSRGGWQRYPTTHPIKVEGGITARSRRGAIGETWWSRRFLATLEAAMAGGRSTRGRSYARKGQVLELAIGPGSITAKVQGSRRAPYRVEVAMPVADEEQWERVVAALAAQAGYAARLLAGQLPHEVEDVFAAEGVPLLPSPTSRLATDCTCPDWANPCKHVAAVCYLAAEAFDRDPFLLLTWRGQDRESVLDRLRQLRGGGEADRPFDELSPAEPPWPSLSDCLLGFWKAGPELADVHVRPVAAEMPAAVLRHVRRGLLVVRGRDVTDVLEPFYGDVVAAAEKRAGGEELLGRAVNDRSRQAASSHGSRTARGPAGG